MDMWIAEPIPQFDAELCESPLLHNSAMIGVPGSDHVSDGTLRAHSRGACKEPLNLYSAPLTMEPEVARGLQVS
jgi:hypothetical protein